VPSGNSYANLSFSFKKMCNGGNAASPIPTMEPACLLRKTDCVLESHQGRPHLRACLRRECSSLGKEGWSTCTGKRKWKGGGTMECGSGKPKFSWGPVTASTGPSVK
jgi:hypothetical protein